MVTRAGSLETHCSAYWTVAPDRAALSNPTKRPIGGAFMPISSLPSRAPARDRMILRHPPQISRPSSARIKTNSSRSGSSEGRQFRPSCGLAQLSSASVAPHSPFLKNLRQGRRHFILGATAGRYRANDNFLRSVRLLHQPERGHFAVFLELLLGDP